MMAVIFAGNGINQNEGLVYSWEDLLDKVVEYLQSEKEKKGDGKAADKKKLERPKVDGLSMTMGFELLEFFAVDNDLANNGYMLKKNIAKEAHLSLPFMVKIRTVNRQYAQKEYCKSDP